MKPGGFYMNRQIEKIEKLKNKREGREQLLISTKYICVIIYFSTISIRFLFQPSGLSASPYNKISLFTIISD